MKILNLTLKKEFFDLIISGEKREEYRVIKPFWRTRLEDPPEAPLVFNPKEFDVIKFVNGYGNDKPTMLVECKGIKLGDSRPEWCGGVEGFFYVLELGEILETKNLIK